jgi:hypothetical protein
VSPWGWEIVAYLTSFLLACAVEVEEVDEDVVDVVEYKEEDEDE